MSFKVVSTGQQVIFCDIYFFLKKMPTRLDTDNMKISAEKLKVMTLEREEI